MKALLLILFPSVWAVPGSLAGPADTTVVLNNVPVDFRLPKGKAVGAILVLPGWNFSRSDVCSRSGFCAKAVDSGYILVLPEMLKSVYASELFPETKPEWRKYPTIKWITDTLLPYCRKTYKIFKKGGRNFLFGISTGGRGVALVAESTGEIFMAGAALSGDFDQTAMPNDNLMKGYFGPFEKFKIRWEGVDNPLRQSEKLKTPLYLAHGKKDKVVPCEQTINFAGKIMAQNPAAGHEVHICDTCKHNYYFWNSQVDSVLRFFAKKR